MLLCTRVIEYSSDEARAEAQITEDIYTYVYIRMYTYIYVHTYMYVHIYTYTYKHTHIYMNIHHLLEVLADGFSLLASSSTIC